VESFTKQLRAEWFTLTPNEQDVGIKKCSLLFTEGLDQVVKCLDRFFSKEGTSGFGTAPLPPIRYWKETYIQFGGKTCSRTVMGRRFTIIGLPLSMATLFQPMRKTRLWQHPSIDQKSLPPFEHNSDTGLLERKFHLIAEYTSRKNYAPGLKFPYIDFGQLGVFSARKEKVWWFLHQAKALGEKLNLTSSKHPVMG
jgi:hypothetical protein